MLSKVSINKIFTPEKRHVVANSHLEAILYRMLR